MRDITPADVRCAALNVCGYSNDVDDARELLAMLGIIELLAP